MLSVGLIMYVYIFQDVSVLSAFGSFDTVTLAATGLKVAPIQIQYTTFDSSQKRIQNL